MNQTAPGLPRRHARTWRFLRTAARLLLRRPLLSVSVIPVLPDGRIVLVRRVDNHLWSLPGGIMEWGETVRETAWREVHEETGLEVVDLVHLQGVYSRPDRDPRTHAATVSVIASVQGRREAIDTIEVSDVRAFQPGDLPLGSFAHDHERQIEDYLAGRTVID